LSVPVGRLRVPSDRLGVPKKFSTGRVSRQRRFVG